MKCPSIFSGKNGKKYFKITADFLPRMLSINGLHCNPLRIIQSHSVQYNLYAKRKPWQSSATENPSLNISVIFDTDFKLYSFYFDYTDGSANL